MIKREEDHFFVFTAKERRGLLIVLLLNVMIIFAPSVYYRVFKSDSPGLIDISNQLPALDECINPSGKTSQAKVENKSGKIDSDNLVEFDPNTASFDQWKKFGLKEKTITTIQRYLDKGGRFKKPEDIRKIWGISTSDADRLLPFIKIQVDKKAALYQQKNSGDRFNAQRKIDINTADSAAFESLYGIGPALASRMVKYRIKLGGFYQIEQIGEVWGLQDSIFQKIKEKLVLTERGLTRMNINSISFDALRSHPYVGYPIAKAIIRFRDQHGDFKALEDIQQILVIDEEKYNKIKHYLAVE